MSTLYIRNASDTGWIEFKSADEISLGDLKDVIISGSPGGGDVLAFNASTQKWEPNTIFSGLAKITVSSGSPANPTVGDIWIDIS